MLEAALFRSRSPVDRGQIAPLGRARPELTPELLRRRLVSGEDHESRDVAVQTMYRVNEAPFCP